MLGSQRVKVLGIVLIINKIIICFSQVSHHSKYAIEKVREQSPFAKSIISQDFMSFVFFIFRLHVAYHCVYFSPWFESCVLKIIFTRGEEITVECELWIEDEKELEIGEALTDAAKLLRHNFTR